MIGLFRKPQTQVEAAQQSVDLARRKAADLHLQLRDAERELASIKAASIEQAMELGHVNDDSIELASQTASVEILTAAVAKARADLAVAERQLTEARDQKQRQKSIGETEQLRASIKEDAEQLLAVIARLRPSTKRAATFALDVAQVSGWLEQIAAEAPQAFKTADTALVHHAELVRLGATRATLPAPAVQPQPPTPPAALNTKTVTLRYGARWICPHSGTQKYGGKGWDSQVLAHVAERAVRAGVAYWEWDERTNELRRTRAGPPTGVDDSVNLDAEDVGPPQQLERWIGPSGIVRHEPIKTSAPLTALTGQQEWMNPHASGGE